MPNFFRQLLYVVLAGIWCWVTYALVSTATGAHLAELQRLLGAIAGTCLVALVFVGPIYLWLAREQRRIQRLGEPRLMTFRLIRKRLYGPAGKDVTFAFALICFGCGTVLHFVVATGV